MGKSVIQLHSALMLQVTTLLGVTIVVPAMYTHGVCHMQYTKVAGLDSM